MLTIYNKQKTRHQLYTMILRKMTHIYCYNIERWVVSGLHKSFVNIVVECFNLFNALLHFLL
jgi:hypothetical protein